MESIPALKQAKRKQSDKVQSIKANIKATQDEYDATQIILGGQSYADQNDRKRISLIKEGSKRPTEGWVFDVDESMMDPFDRYMTWEYKYKDPEDPSA